jgi:hypothetical protein
MQPRLRFQCQPGCTACCEQRGFVYLTEADLERVAAFTGMTAAEFERKYVYRTAKRMRLRTPRGKHCPFLAGGGCSIHPAKPTQCRIFPFWPEIASSRREWRKTAKYCPGMSKGPLISIRSVREQAEEMRKGYPAMYEE